MLWSGEAVLDAAGSLLNSEMQEGFLDLAAAVAAAVKNFKDLEDDAYYIAHSKDKAGSCLLYYWPYALDEEGACNYLTALAIAKGKPSDQFEKNGQTVGLNGIYTKTKQAAEQVAKAYDARGPMISAMNTSISSAEVW